MIIGAGSISAYNVLLASDIPSSFTSDHKTHNFTSPHAYT